MPGAADRLRPPADRAVPVTFGTVRADCRLLGRRAEAPTVAARLDDIALHRLPAAVAEALAPLLAGLGGVIRINTLALSFDLSRRELDTGELARLWADRIAAALRVEIAGGPGANVAIFADHGDFAAAYLERRFGEAAHPDWAFEDFAPLRHVAPSRAAVEILKSRPEYLPALARRSARRGDAARLVQRLSPEESAELLAALGQPDRHLPREDLARWATRALSALRVTPWSSRSPAARALTVILNAASAEDAPGLPLLVAAGELASAVADLAAALGTTAPTAAALRRALGRAGPGALTGPTRATLAPFTEDDPGETLLRQMLAALAAPEPHAPRSDSVPEAPEKPAPAPPPADTEALVASPFAGVALCLTTLRRLEIPARLGPEATHALAVALVGPDLRPLARTDPLVARLFPADAARPVPPFPEVPEVLCAPLAGAQRAAVAEASGADAWALVVLAHVARALPGLTASSAGYMRRQFVHVGGVLHWMDDAVEVTLDPVPLGVVLSMAGATGWQGPLPWLDGRDLVIRIREERAR